MISTPSNHQLDAARALTACSGSALVFLLFYADRVYLWMHTLAGIALIVGVHWLWADFINANPRPEE